MMRIGIGGISHETNAFSSVSTTREAFRRRFWQEGQEVLDKNSGVQNYVGGIISAAQTQGVTLVPTLVTEATPSGLITAEAFETMRDRLIDGLIKAHREQPLDGIALTLHGAGVADGYPDIEGEILRAVREAFGDSMPVGVVLDLHGNVTPEMVARSDILLGVKGYPHTDAHKRGADLINLLCSVVRTGVRPAKRLLKLPWVFGSLKSQTLCGPAHDVRALCEACESGDEDLLQATFFHGFPYSDIPQAGVCVVTLAKTQQSADRNAQRIAAYAWERRAEFVGDGMMPSQAVDKALTVPGSPIVINESSDNPGGGAPGDGTHLLRELLVRNLPGTAMGPISDPETVRLVHEAGTGATISCLLGAKTDDLHGTPVALKDAYVKCLTDGRFINCSPMNRGQRMDIGRCARLTVGNVEIIVASNAQQVLDNGVFELHGIDVMKMRIIGLKSAQHFRAWWQDVAAHIVTTDPPGVFCGNLETFHFKHLNKGYYPFNQHAEIACV